MDDTVLQMLSSALVATQVDAGSAAQVPAVLAQLRNATDQGQLQASAIHPWFRAFPSLQWPSEGHIECD